MSKPKNEDVYALGEALRRRNGALTAYRVAVEFPEGASEQVFTARIDRALVELRAAERKLEEAQVPVYGEVVAHGWAYGRDKYLPPPTMSPVLIEKTLARLDAGVGTLALEFEDAPLPMIM